MNKFLLLSLVFLWPFISVSGKNKNQKMDIAPLYTQLPVNVNWTAEMPPYFDTHLEKVNLAAEKRGNRKVASQLNDSNVKNDVKQFRDRFLSLKDTPNSSKASNELDQILFDLEGAMKSENASNDLKFFAAQLTPLRAFRGIFHRIRGFASKAVVIQSFLVTVAKQVAQNVDVFLTDENSQHMKVLFRYISEPYNYDVTRPLIGLSKYAPSQLLNYGVSAFATEYDMQNWLLSTVMPSLNNSIETLKKLNSAADKTMDQIVWDNAIIYGNNYADANDRYRTIGNAEVNAVLSNLYGNVANIYIFCSYGANGLLELAKNIGYLYGVEQVETIRNGFLANIGISNSGDAHLKGASSLARFDKLKDLVKRQKENKDKSYPWHLFQLIEKKDVSNFSWDGGDLMKRAFIAVVSSTFYASVSWHEAKNRDADDSFVFDGALAKALKASGQKSIDQMVQIVRSGLSEAEWNGLAQGTNIKANEDIKSKWVPIHSAVSGDLVAVNLFGMFFFPPKDLTAFAPSHDKNEAYIIESPDILYKGKPVPYRNYFQGTARDWNLSAFDAYFKIYRSGQLSSLSNASDIKAVIRTTNQSWGGLIIGLPLANIVL